MATTHRADLPPPRLPGVLLGIGLGGFVDGIVLHQVLQWHHMVSARESPTTVAGLQLNTLADGWFHVASWLAVVAGTVLLLRAWRSGRPPQPPLGQAGLLLGGWGLFNLVEGLIDHQILGLHHVRDDLGGPLAWDLGFLALGALQIVSGWALWRAGERRALDRSRVGAG